MLALPFELLDWNRSGKGVTTLAQMAQAILGNSPVGRLLFYIFQLSTALILAVAANTGFSAFPMLSYNMAKINICHTCIWKKEHALVIQMGF